MWYSVMIIILGWIVCGLLAWGILFAYSQEEFKLIAVEDYREDLACSIFLGILGGPVVVVAAFFNTGFAKHGLRWW